MAIEESPHTAGAVSDDALESLHSKVRGALLRPEDVGYDEARRVWNGMIDKRPALIAQCSGTADVVATVNFAREQSLPIAVRGGGHNVAGNAVCDGGVVIDLRQMNSVYVDPGRRLARVQGGATWGDLDHETQLHGLIVPGGVVSTTGVGGLTLGGGLSATRRKWGLTCDHIEFAEVVTADGEVLTASESSHPDLYWALRGGGGSFGIVTSFVFRLRSLGPEMYIAAPIYALEAGPDVVRAWCDFMAEAPDEITSDLIFWSMPPLPGIDPDVVGSPIVICAGWYAGSPSRGERALQPFGEFATPIADLSHVGRYVEVQSTFDAFFPDTQRYYWKSLFMDEPGDDEINAIVEFAANRPSPRSLMILRALGGEIARVPEDASAYANRQAGYNLSFDTTWVDPVDDGQMVDWTRQAWSQMREKTRGGVYLNFAGLEEERGALARAAFGGNYERLLKVKRTYDPLNMFQGSIPVSSSQS